MYYKIFIEVSCGYNATMIVEYDGIHYYNWEDVKRVYKSIKHTAYIEKFDIDDSILDQEG